jgi:hypothetical protein
MYQLNAPLASLSRDMRRALGVTRRDIKRAARCANIDVMARRLATQAESEPVEDSIFDLIESECAGYADSLSAWN